MTKKPELQNTNMPALTIGATGGAALTAIEAISMLNLLTISFPALNFLSNGVPTSNSVSNVVQKTKQLETPPYLHSYLQKNHMNQRIDKNLEKSILNAEKAKKYAEKTLKTHRLIFTAAGINIEALSKIMKNKQKTEKHYILAMENAKATYKEIARDLLKEHQNLSFLGADTNYTGPISQIHEKTKEIISKLDKANCGEEKDIATTVGCLTKKINTYRNTTGEFTPSLFNEITQSFVPKYAELKEQIQKRINNLKREYEDTEELQRRKINKANEEIKELERQKTNLINWNPGSTHRAHVETSIAGTPRQQLLKIKENKERSVFLAQKAEEIKESKRDNYLVESVTKYKDSLSKAKIAYKESENLLKRLRNIEETYKDKIKGLKSQMKQTLATRYWERIETKYKGSLQEPTYGERIESLKDTYEYVKSVKNAEDKEIVPIKNKIQRLLKRIQKYQELGYSFEDKIKKLKHLQDIENPKMIPRTQEVYSEIKELVENRITPLKQRIERKRQESSRYLRSAEQLSKTPSTQGKINIQLLKKLKQKHKKTVNQPSLKKPKKTLKTYNKVINQIHTSIKQLKSKFLSENTQIQTKKQETIPCNQEIDTELTLSTKNRLSVPLYNTKIMKTIKETGEETSFYIPVLEPSQTTQKTTTTTITPYTCTEYQEKTIRATEDWLTKMKKIKVHRNVEHKETLITQYIPQDTRIVYLGLGKRTKDGEIKLNMNSRNQNVTITYKKHPKLDIEEQKQTKSNQKIQYTINIINNGEKISNLTLIRNIDPVGKIDSNYPIQKRESYIKITVPELETQAKIEMTYRSKSLKEEAQKALMQLNQLNYTKKVPDHIKDRINEINQLYRNQEYKSVIRKSPDLINELQALPSESEYNYIKAEETGYKSNETKTSSRLEESKLITMTERASELCELAECEDLRRKVEELKNVEDPKEEDVVHLKSKIERLEKEAMEKVKGNRSRINEVFKSLEKAFSISEEFSTEEKKVPYSQEDLKSLQKRKKSLNEEELVFGVAEPSFDQLTEENDIEKIKRKLEDRKTLIEDAEDTLSNIKESSALRLKRAKEVFSEDKKEVTRKYLEKAKSYHEEGEYFNSMLASRKVVKFSKNRSGGSLPLKYIAAGIILSGTTLYILKKPSDDEEDTVGDAKMKLKRGK